MMTATPTPAQGASSCTQSTAGTSTPQTPPGYVIINFTNECGQAVPLAVDVASNPDEWETGLMSVINLPQNQGELFDFHSLAGGNQIEIGFWMEDTPTPLSIAFIGKESTVHEVQDMQAETTTPHLPSAPYLYAVEANLGWFQANDIVPGSTVDLSAATSLPAGTAPPQSSGR
jgi:uncharacterized membrane protein (UPF0127 family)